MITVNDLKDQTLTQDKSVLYCEICGETYSANKGDYFWKPKNEVFECCDEPLKLVVKKVVYEEIKP